MSPTSNEVIGFLGLGQMGRPMAQHLRAAGHKVQAFDISPQSRAIYEKGGGTTAASAKDACDAASIVITMLPNGAVVQEALLGNEAIKAVKPEALVLEMSSSAPMQTRQLGNALNRYGIAIMDAPVSGGVTRAVSGKLAVMVGGTHALLERARPILQCFAQSIALVGPLGAGHAMKALNNYVSAAGLVAACEAVIVGREFGLAPETIIETLNASTGRNNSTETKMNQFVLSGSFGSGFSMALMAKDIATAAELSKSIGVEAAGIQSSAQLWRDAAEMINQGADHTAIFEYLAANVLKKGR